MIFNFNKIGGLVGQPLNKFQSNVEQAMKAIGDCLDSITGRLDALEIKDEFYEVYGAASYNASANGILKLNNIPAGTYYFTVGNQAIQHQVSDSCYMYGVANGVSVKFFGTPNICYAGGSVFQTYSAGYLLGLNSSTKIVFTEPVNDLALNLAITAGSFIYQPYMRLRKINRDTEVLITDEWD